MNQLERHTISFLLFSLYLLTNITAFEDSIEGRLDETDPDLEKRLYDFGLGKRAYSYVSEYKRLPVYNFGLGKRSKLYNFGLGKRDDQQAEPEYEYEDQDGLPEEEIYDDDDLQTVEKRQRTYSFGLGKRKPKYEFGLGKRLPKYEFGLGKRSKYDFGLGKRERLYNFGLGKRERLYNFGLGKRERLYNFGLGKRSDDLKTEKNLGKREVNNKEMEEIENSTEQNQTVPIDSHESMGQHSERVHLVHKRSIRNYDFGLGKREDVYQNPDEYIRQYRKPYSFGLGKRVPKYDFGLGKRSYDNGY